MRDAPHPLTLPPRPLPANKPAIIIATFVVVFPKAHIMPPAAGACGFPKIGKIEPQFCAKSRIKTQKNQISTKDSHFSINGFVIVG